MLLHTAYVINDDECNCPQTDGRTDGRYCDDNAALRVALRDKNPVDLYREEATLEKSGHIDPSI